MSLFKIKHWWSNERSQNEEYDHGIQNGNCIIVDKFSSHSDSDLIIVGQSTIMKIYKPLDNNNSQPILETQLKEIVLQIETGKFLADYADRQILILHPNSYEIYVLSTKDGHSDIGDENSITPVITHSFTRRAYSVTRGPFGNAKSRDLICIQALDGTLSFFDQDTFLFMCVFNDIIVPGPVCYVANSDIFVICKSTWILEIYSYHQMSELSELSVRPNKKNIPQWIYNAGEEIISVQVIRTSANFSSIIAMGEMHLYCFQDNGLMKHIIRFDYIPICFHPYLIGWYYEPNSRLLTMVASEDEMLFIYEGTTLLWSCDLTHNAISLYRYFSNSLSGGLVTLSANGVVAISYLGTEPDLNSNANPMNEAFDPNQVQEEIEEVEASLQRIMNTKGDLEEKDIDINQFVNIKIDVGEPVNNLPSLYATEDDEVKTIQSCPIVVTIECKDPKLVQSVQITYDCVPPIACSDNTICLDNVNGTEIVKTHIFLSGNANISDTTLNIKFTIINNLGRVIVDSKKTMLPLNLFCYPIENVPENKFKLTIKTNQTRLDLTDIFTDFKNDHLANYIEKDTLTFTYRTSKATVTIKAYNNAFTIEADEFTEISPIVEYLINKLEEYYIQTDVNDYEIAFEINIDLIRQILQRFLKSIESHAKERIKLRDLEDELNVLQRQFILVQKRLLVQYGSLPPGNCDTLEFLMKDTHDRIKMTAFNIIQNKETLLRSGNILRSNGNLIVRILNETVTDKLKLKLIEEMLSLESLNGHFQEWEESVAQVSSYILNKILKKSEKDKEKLAPVTDQDILSPTNLKKLLKQLRVILEKIFSEIQDFPTYEGKVKRIEEFVEVI